jgi:polyisoprenoid-binding protein YceI
MKKLSLILFLFSCSLIFGQQKVDVSASNIKWTGSQISGKSHFGSLKFKTGNITIKNNVVESGVFVVDMTSLSVDDLEGRGKKSLEGHLNSDDFFSVESFPTSSLTISSGKQSGPSSFDVSGILTIKGVSQRVSFSLNLEENNSASAKLTFDRSKFNVRYGSGSFFENLGDKLILDNIDLEISLLLR